MRKYRIPLSLLTAIFIIAVIGGSIYSYFILNTFAAVNECVISSSQTYGQADLNTCAGGTMDNLTINGGVILTLTEAITLSGTVTVNGTITHTAEDTDGVNITAANINISATGLINTNAKGCQGGNGGATNGYGPNTSTGICAINTSGYGGAHASGSGAGHGGRGGRGHTDAGGTTYDSSTIPALLGSGGGGGSGPAGGYGGGKIILTVSGTLTVNGTISANGQNGPTTITNGGGGGSGGSVYISTSVITGSATISANGGNGGEGSQYAGGGGGGGRVAVYYNDAAGFTLSNITSTKGLAGTGVGSRLDGSDGTTYTFQYLVPTQPSISYPLPNSYSLPLTNFTIISSIFPTDSQYKTHTSSDWKIQTGSNCNTNTGIIWSSLDDTTNKTSITVEGTLIANTTYYACTRYTNSVGDATWSTSVQFQTIPDIATSTQNYNFSTSEEYTIGSQVSVAGGVATTNSILWYNSSWTKRVPITITEASGSTLTNYAVRLSVTYDADMQADFDDIRFIDSDGTTLMDHWLETKIDSTSSVFWVEIPTLTASTAQTIYMYYGNVDATSVSSGANTFTMFDDFESYVDDSAINGQGGWVTQRVGGSGYAKIATLNGRKYLRSKTTSSGTTVYRALTTDNTGYAIRTSVYASNYTEAFIIDLLDGTYQSAGNITNGYGALFGGWTNTQGSLRSTSSGSVSDSTFVHSFTNSTAYALDFIWNGSTLTMKQNDLTIKTRTLSTYSSLSYVDIEAWNTLDIYTDWFLVRKYVSTEPTVGVPGAEVSSFANTALRIINATGLTYNQLYNFTETLGSDTNGEVKYQISNNGTNWYYFNTSTYAWTSATEGNLSHTNTDDEVNAYLGQFVDDIGTGSLYIGSYLIANGGTIDLSNLAVTYIAGPNFSTAELTEPINTPSVGAALTFTATIPNSASVTGTNTAFVVNVPSTMTYVANSITLGALSKTDTIDDDETQYDSENTRITVNIGNINGSSSATITFQLTVNEGLDHLQNIAINGVISADNALSDITITKNILVIGTTASNIPVGLTLTLVSNDATDLSATSVAGPQNIKFKKGSDSIATMNIRFNSDDQPDFSVINSDVDTSNKKAFLHGFSNLSESVKVEPTYTLIVPGSSPNNRVVVCPGAEDFSSISKICTNHIVLEDGESTTYNGYTVAANWSGSGWEVSGLTSTGGGEIPPNNLPVATTPGSISQATDGSGYLTFTTQISDADSEDTTLKVEYSDNGGSTWYDPYLISATPSSGSVDLDNNQTYQIGTSNNIDTSTGTITLTIVWDTQSTSNGNGALTNDQSDIQIRVTPADEFDTGTVQTNTSFEVDNADPSGMGSFIVGSYTSTTTTLTWAAVSSENNFTKYIICYDTLDANVTEACGSGNVWDENDDSDFTTMTTATTTITGLSEDTTYYYKLIALDDYGNKTSVNNIAQNSNGVPIVSGLAGIQDTDGDHDVTIQFTANDSDGEDTLQAAIEYTTNGSTWNLATLSSATQSNPATPEAQVIINNEATTYNLGTEAGYIQTSQGSNVLSVVWDTDSDIFNTNSNNIQVRVKLTDGLEATSYTTSTAFVVDQVSPSGIGSLTTSNLLSTSITLNWTAVTETNFTNYLIYYGTNQTTVTNETSDSWGATNDTNLNTKTTASTIITNLTGDATYYFKIKASDNYGNTVNATTNAKTNDLPLLSSITATPKTDGSGEVDITVNLIDNDEDNLKLKILYDEGAAQSSANLDSTVSGTNQIGTITVDNNETYQIGASNDYVESSSTANQLSFTWNSAINESAANSSNFKICIIANDLKEDGSELCSDTFTLDNLNPVGLDNLQISTTQGQSTVSLTWTALTVETNFSNYIVYYSDNQDEVTNESEDVISIDDNDENTLATMSTNSLDISNLTIGTTYYIKIKALDTYSHYVSTTVSSFTIEAEEEEQEEEEQQQAPSPSSSPGGSSGSSSRLQRESSSDNSLHQSAVPKATGSSSKETVSETTTDNKNTQDEQVQIVDTIQSISVKATLFPTEIDQVEEYIDEHLANHWASDYYRQLLDIQKAYINELKFMAPQLLDVDEDMSRLEVIVAMGDLMQVKLPTDIEGDPFTDFKKENKYADYLQYFKDKAVIRGYSDGSFKANAKANRVEVLKMVLTALDADIPDLYDINLLNYFDLKSNPFSDIDLDQWYAPYVLYAYKQKIVGGYSDGFFRPTTNITNSQIVKILVLAMENL